MVARTRASANGSAGSPVKANSGTKRSSVVDEKDAALPAQTLAVKTDAVDAVVSDDVFHEYEFGGPIGVTAMMVGFPILMYYLWACLIFYDGKLVVPKSSSLDDIKAFVNEFWIICKNHAYPSRKGAEIYLGLVAIQLFLAAVVPGYKQPGLPVSSLKGKRLMYNCNALGCWYSSLIITAILHFTGIFKLSLLIDHFGEIMTWAMLCGFTLAAVCYGIGVTVGSPVRMSGNVIYDYFAGAVLNPRIGNIDIKMWAEVRIPWILIFLIALGGAAKQYDTYGYVTPNMGVYVLGTGLYINACAKAEELIPMTWDMVYEKFGWLLSFWNLAGVPFMYCYSCLWMATHDPEMYRFPLWANILMYVTLITAYCIFDISMAQKSYFKMEQDGNMQMRKGAFPQLPGIKIKNPKYIQTKQGGKLLVDGFWAYARKPNYTADWVQVFCECVCAGFSSFITWYHLAFFTAMLIHRTGRDFERCHRKYKESWEEYMRVVPYKFIPYVY